MSIAMSPYLSVPVPQGFVGQRDQGKDLLEALLQSCHKAASNPRLPGYGRSLEPYFSEPALPPKTPQPEMSKIQSPQQTAKKNKKGKGNTSSGSSSDEDFPKKKRGSRNGPFAESGTSQNTRKGDGQTIKAVHIAQKPTTPSKIVWAGKSKSVDDTLVVADTHQLGSKEKIESGAVFLAIKQKPAC